VAALFLVAEEQRLQRRYQSQQIYLQQQQHGRIINRNANINHYKDESRSTTTPTTTTTTTTTTTINK
jgi:hypothetical protein